MSKKVKEVNKPSVKEIRCRACKIRKGSSPELHLERVRTNFGWNVTGQLIISEIDAM